MQDPDPGFRPEHGQAQELEPGLRRIVAPNPSPMTFRGTNTYLLGRRDVAVIDPGPANAAHLDAILSATRGARISHILVTHAHIDHSPGATPLQAATGAPVVALGDHLFGRSEIMTRLAAQGLAGGGEGVDPGFAPDEVVSDGARIETAEWQVEVLATPGHFGNHAAFACGDVAFVGDLVMGWASSLVSPPDGDLTDFMASCRALRARPWRQFHSGHGAEIDDPGARLDWLIAHREGREAQIAEALAEQPDTAGGLARRIYRETPAALIPAATRNVFAHLVDLTARGRAAPVGELSENVTFSLLP